MAIIRFRYNPKNNTISELLKVARHVEQSQFYIDRDDCSLSQQPKSTSLKSKSSKPAKGSTKPEVTNKKEMMKPTSSRPSGSVTCHTCKKPGHISTRCPTKPQTSKTSRAARETEGEEPAPQAAKVSEDFNESSNEIQEVSDHENASADQDDQGTDYRSLSEQESNDDGLADWTAATQIADESDSQSEDEEEVVKYQGPPLSTRKSLVDWTEMTGYLSEQEMSEHNKVVLHEMTDGSNETTAQTMYSAHTRVVEDNDTVGPQTSRAGESSGEQVAFRNRVTKEIRTEDGPKRNFKNPGVIEGYVMIGEIKAHVLLDCGSTLDMISANYAASAKLDMFQLKKPVKLQMATTGSKSTINFGARTEVKIGNFSQKRYFDVVNLDQYDMILGTPFLKDNEVILNFRGNGSFKIADRWFPVGSKELKHSLHREEEGVTGSSKNKKGTQPKKSH